MAGKQTIVAPFKDKTKTVPTDPFVFQWKTAFDTKAKENMKHFGGLHKHWWK